MSRQKNTVRQKTQSGRSSENPKIPTDFGKSREIPGIFGNFRGLSRNFPEISGIFRNFPKIPGKFPEFHEFPSIFRKFPKFHVLTHGSWNSFKTRGGVSCERMKDCDTDSSQFNFPEGLRKSH